MPDADFIDVKISHLIVLAVAGVFSGLVLRFAGLWVGIPVTVLTFVLVWLTLHRVIAWPRTLPGWRSLFYITIRRCPRCHGRLVQDWSPYDDGYHVYCCACGGLILPRGFWRALAMNARYYHKNPGQKTPVENIP